MPLSPDQRRRVALANRLSAGYPRRVRLALLEAMGVEANYGSPHYGDRDSEGPLQQRPSQGWGPASESDATDIQQFLVRARVLERRGFKGSAGQLAQAIQRSAYPGRYDQRAGEAASLLGLRGGGNVDGADPGTPGVRLRGTVVPTPAASADLRKQFALSLIQGRPLQETLGLAQALRQPSAPAASILAAPPPGVSGAPARTGAPSSRGYAGLDEVIYHAPGHEDHLHVAEGTDPRLLLQVIQRAQSLGLSVRENPYTDPVDPVHVKGSYHYRRFPGRYKGRRLGEAADISGDKRKLELLYRELGGRTRY